MQKHYEKWNNLAPIGLLIIGAGLSLTGDAIVRKSQGKDWFIRGTIGIVLFNAGIAIFGDSVKERALYELELKKHRS